MTDRAIPRVVAANPSWSATASPGPASPKVAATSPITAVTPKADSPEPIDSAATVSTGAVSHAGRVAARRGRGVGSDMTDLERCGRPRTRDGDGDAGR
jgi:hypothetical protein